jgi:tRNA(Ile)-lysidine synthase
VSLLPDSFSPSLPLAVAFSGGADSTALLASCARRWPGQVLAVHVNHQLQAAAADFEVHCAAACKQMDVPLRVLRVHAAAVSGQSPEDAARTARYQAFERLVSESFHEISQISDKRRGNSAIQSIALAHHADDQLETFLIALSRGSGLAGLSAMAAHMQRGGVTYLRPFLHLRARDIRAWLSAHDLAFIEDPSNADLRFTRNRIRARVLPVLLDALPSLPQTVQRSMAHLVEAQSLLDEVAAMDGAACLDPQGAPRIAVLQEISRARQGNLLRYWLKHWHDAIPSTTQLHELLDQVAVCTTRGHRIDIKLADGRIRREGDVLHWYNP